MALSVALLYEFKLLLSKHSLKNVLTSVHPGPAESGLVEFLLLYFIAKDVLLKKCARASIIYWALRLIL